MKKILIVILIIVAVLSFSACENESGIDIEEKEIPMAMEGNPKIKIVLDGGKVINLELFPEVAPITVENFLRLVDEGFYTNTFFHRVISGFMIQTGWFGYENSQISYKPTQTSITGEFSQNGIENDLAHEAGVISMARSASSNSASAQFFICSDDSPHLDGSYAAFGKVMDEQSMKNVKEISRVSTLKSVTVNVNGSSVGLGDMPGYVSENGNAVLQLILIKSIARI